METCERCLSKPVSFQCTICTSYRNLCTRCDNIIHNISSKQNHRRIAINKTISQQEIKEEENPALNQNLNTSDINLEFEKDLNNNNQKMNSIGVEQIDQISNINNITSKNNNLLLSQMRKSLNEYNNKNNNNSFLQIDSSRGVSLNHGSAFNTNLLIADKYSKEYVNEIKKVFKKEKECLEYKNKTLQYSLDKIKLEFTDHINNLTKQLEDNQNTNILNINTIKDNYESKISELNEKHDIEIKSLSKNITQLEAELDELKNSYNNEINSKNVLINKLNTENDRLKNELKKKNDELCKIKNSFEVMTKQY
jgi:hypothetical protein